MVFNEKRKHDDLAGITPNSHHREFNLVDEESWQHTYYLPLANRKWKKNPTPLYGNENFDSQFPRLIYCPDLNPKFYLFFVQIGAPTGVYVATSNDLKGPYSEPQIIGVLNPHPNLPAQNFPTVIYDPYATGIGTDKKWKMWYAGSFSPVPTFRGILFATADDPLGPWTNHGIVIESPTNLGIEPRLTSAVLRMGGLFYMAVQNFNFNLSIYTSSDGINWTFRGEPLKISSEVRALTGTLQVTSNSNVVTGTSTKFKAEIIPNSIIKIGSDTKWYEVASIESDTSLTIAELAITTVSGTGSLMGYDNDRIGFFSLYWNSGVWYLSYAGAEKMVAGATYRYRVFLATSTDGLSYRKLYDDQCPEVMVGADVPSNILHPGDIIRLEKNYYILFNEPDPTKAGRQALWIAELEVAE